MKKLSPYIFPAIVLGLVFLLVFRWYTMRTDRVESGLLSEGVIIENLSEDEVQALDSVADFQAAEMVSTSEDATGTVKYEVKDDKVTFTVAAVLPEEETEYQVWLQEVDSETTRHAFDLEMKKGGYIGSAAFSADLLPLKVVVRNGANLTGDGAGVLLETTIEAPEAME